MRQPRKPLEEISLDLVGASAAIDLLHEDLVAYTNPVSGDVLMALNNHRGAALAALAAYEGYLMALRGFKAHPITQPGKIASAFHRKHQPKKQHP